MLNQASVIMRTYIYIPTIIVANLFITYVCFEGGYACEKIKSSVNKQNLLLIHTHNTQTYNYHDIVTVIGKRDESYRVTKMRISCIIK